MKIYLVGGAVRDQLLGKPIKEKDWVVVGATPHDMLQKGFRQVGKDFPVFLHPKTHEEYALARKERKIGKGYTGFDFDTAPTVTLEEDLLRRDITINAIAMAEDGTLIDPYHGQEDLQKKLLRHVSPAFAEDPVRILRVGRFAARFGFTVAPSTFKLMRDMVHSGEVDALVSERVWKELERALVENYPELFFSVLAECGALSVLFPSIQYNSPGVKTLNRTPPLTHLRFAVLLHHLCQEDINTLCARYKIPKYEHHLALLVSNYLPAYTKSTNMTAEELLNILNALDAFRREQRFDDFLTVCEACSTIPSTQLYQAYQVAKNIDTTLIIKNYQGKMIAEKIKEMRYQAIQAWLTKL
jgi:tRNA nucleotidyltransferase (CCA-adding enzyme)